jgi:glutamate-1-semialdehyde 2,1-aminomutase
MPRTIDRNQLKAALAFEQVEFMTKHPRSSMLHEEAKKHLHDGVPMNWMTRWASDFPLFVESAEGCYFTDVDGLSYLDLCLGDTGAMTGHAPAPTVAAIQRQLQRGTSFMLPTEDSLWLGKELKRRFGLPFWQMTLSATDANRFVIRIARHITQRPKILVFNWCYHGTVDESFITLLPDGSTQARAGHIGPPVNPSLTTKVVEFNDIPALEAALKDGDVAAILAEPVMTNIGIVHPSPEFHAAMREISRKTGTLLILDETHTICAGEGGYTREHGLEPDFLTIGKPIAGGIPAGLYGFTAEISQKLRQRQDYENADTSGIGGTLAGNALSIAAMKATLGEVLTADAYEKTIPLATRFCDGVMEVVREFDLDWHVSQLGCRAEYWFCATPPRNGGEAAAAVDPMLDRYMHLAALNRGILMTPFHNMALIAPSCTAADIDKHTEVFRDSIRQLIS